MVSEVIDEENACHHSIPMGSEEEEADLVDSADGGDAAGRGGRSVYFLNKDISISPSSSVSMPPPQLLPSLSSSASSMPSFFPSSSTVEASSFSSNPWGWVARLDELSLSMQNCSVFWGFQEASIAFPPSYRWRTRRLLPLTTTHKVEEEEEEEEKERKSIGGDDIEEGKREGNDSGDDQQSLGGGGGGGGAMESLAGDFTDLDRLNAAYSTVVQDYPTGGGGADGFVNSSKPTTRLRLLSRLSSTVPSPSRRSSPSSFVASFLGSSYHQNKSVLDTTQQASTTTSSKRTPSYTDRILTHSLPGKASDLQWQAYELADKVDN